MWIVHCFVWPGEKFRISDHQFVKEDKRHRCDTGSSSIVPITNIRRKLITILPLSNFNPNPNPNLYRQGPCCSSCAITHPASPVAGSSGSCFVLYEYHFLIGFATKAHRLMLAHTKSSTESRIDYIGIPDRGILTGYE